MPYIGKKPENIIATAIDSTTGTFSGDVTSAGTVNVTGDTAAGDDAAIGFTSAEGLILTGQGSTSDITVKNDADATVFTVPTGTDDILFPDNAKVMFGAGPDLRIFHDGSNSYIEENGTGDLIVQTNGANFLVENTDGDDMIKAISDGAVEISHNNVKTFETTSTGIDITGNQSNFTASSVNAPSGGNGIIDLVCATARSSGFGPYIGFRVPNSTGSTTTEDMGVIGFVAPDSTDGSRKADFIVNTRNTSFSEKFRIAANGDITATDTSIGSNSDSRLKKDITDYTYDLTKFKSYDVKKFNWKHPELHMDKTNQIGFLAQDLQNIDTQWVSQVPLTPLDEDGNTHIEAQYLDEDLMALTSKLGEKDAMYISVIQQLIARIEALENA